MDGNESVISAPPSPPEVKVRTMQSDLASMARSGGGVPQFESVKVEGWQPGASSAGSTGAGESRNSAMADSPPAGGARLIVDRRSIALFIAIIAAVAALAAIGYFVYTIFFAGSSATPAANTVTPAPAAQPPATPFSTLPPTPAAPQAPASPAPPASSPAPATSAVTNAPTGPFAHASLFKKLADQTLTLTLSSGGPAQTAADLQSFNQKLAGLLIGAKKGPALIEVDVVDANGNGVAVSDILTQQGAAVLDPAFIAAHFNPDATLFVYRDANGNFWPGYVLALNAGENWLFLQSDVKKLESSPSIANFFLTDVGLPTGGFGGSTISGSPVRIISYPAATPPAAFVYGWSNGRLILSTSHDGFAAALAHL